MTSLLGYLVRPPDSESGVKHSICSTLSSFLAFCVLLRLIMYLASLDVTSRDRHGSEIGCKLPSFLNDLESHESS